MYLLNTLNNALNNAAGCPTTGVMSDSSLNILLKDLNAPSIIDAGAASNFAFRYEPIGAAVSIKASVKPLNSA